MFFILGFQAQVATSKARYIVAVRPTTRMVQAGSSDPPEDTDLVQSVSDSSGNDLSAVQATGSKQPIASADPFPGLLGLVFANDDYLAIASPGGTIAEVVVVLGPGCRGSVFAVDTSVTTDKPALIIDVVEEL